MSLCSDNPGAHPQASVLQQQSASTALFGCAVIWVELALLLSSIWTEAKRHVKGVGLELVQVFLASLYVRTHLYHFVGVLGMGHPHSMYGMSLL